MSENWEDEGDLLGEIVTIVTTNDIPETPIEDMLLKDLFASESSLALREKWFSSYKFLAGIPISDKKYKHPRSKYKNNFYPLNNQFDYGLAH